MTRDEMITQIQAEVKGLSSSLDSDDYGNAVSDAERETWSLPQTTDFKIKWIKERSKRHLFSYLLAESAAKFRFNNINLQHRFEHYRQLVADMDKAFATAIKDNPYQFADVSAYEMMGSKIDAGFQYDPQTGIETTYDAFNKVIITPSGTS